MRTRPTELGIKGCLLLAALGVAFFAAAYSNLFFLIIAFCCVLGGLGLWWTIRNPRHVALRVLTAPSAPAGQERELLLAVTTGGGRAAWDLAFEVDLDGGGRERAPHELVHVPVLRGEARCTATLPGLERGVRRITAVRCSSGFPFGLFRTSRSLAADFELVTYPKSLGSGRSGTAVRGGPDDSGDGSRGAAVAGLRPFRAGDSLGDVHWKASARRGEPIVKELERGGGDAAVEIVVDRRCGDDARELEARLSRATTTLEQALAADRPVRLRSQGCELKVEVGQPADALLRWLAAATPLPAGERPPARSRREAARV